MKERGVGWRGEWTRTSRSQFTGGGKKGKRRPIEGSQIGNGEIKECRERKEHESGDSWEGRAKRHTDLSLQ